jgi:hypothetical protein
MVLKIKYSHGKRKKLDLHLLLHKKLIQNGSKTYDLKLPGKKKNKGKNFQDNGLSKNFSDMTSKAQQTQPGVVVHAS